MIEESILDEWALKADDLSKEQVLMLISQLKAYQRNSTIIYVFPQSFFDTSGDRYATPADATITPEKLRGFVLEKAVNADLYFCANSRIMTQDKQPEPPVTVPQPLYRAQVTAEMLNLRDAAGSATDADGESYGVLRFGDVVEVWELVPQAGEFLDRAVISPPNVARRLNAWNKYLMKIEEL